MTNSVSRAEDPTDTRLHAVEQAVTHIETTVTKTDIERIRTLIATQNLDGEALLNEPYFRINDRYNIGAATLLHHAETVKLWKGEKPTVEDFLKQLERPFQLDLLLKHLDIALLWFSLSKSEAVVVHELAQTEMIIRSVCEAVGVDADTVLQEISLISKNVSTVRARPDERGYLNKNSDSE